MLWLATGDVADHVERFTAVCQHALGDPADGAVYEALVRHFADYSLTFISRCTHPTCLTQAIRTSRSLSRTDSPEPSKAWLSDDSVTKTDLVEAAVACAPAWWS